jgi:hypothetical protein
MWMLGNFEAAVFFAGVALWVWALARAMALL